MDELMKADDLASNLDVVSCCIVAMEMYSLVTSGTFVTKLHAALLKYQLESEGRFILSLCILRSFDE